MDLLKLSSSTEPLINQLSIDSTKCLKKLTPLSHCNICIDVCPTHAIQLQDTIMVSDHCQLCGLCVALCPHEVFQIDQTLLRSIPKNNLSIALTCKEQSTTYDSLLIINCLQQLFPAIMLELLSITKQIFIVLDEKKCATCIHHWYPSSLTLQMSQYGIAENQIMIIASPTEIDHEIISITSQENHRRQFLENMWETTKQSSKKTLQYTINKWLNPLEQWIQPKTAIDIHQKRQSLVEYIKTNPQLYTSDQCLPYRMLTIDFCNFCGACAHLCPTKSLQLIHIQEVKQLEYQPQHCNQCNLCLDVCMHKTIHWTDNITITQFLSDQPHILTKSLRKLCENCQQDYWNYPQNIQNRCNYCL